MDKILDKAAISVAQSAANYSVFSHQSMQNLILEICEFSQKASPQSVKLLLNKLGSRGIINRHLIKIKDGLQFVSFSFNF